ncbi:MAG TPA: G1 family glutamic endopeptidase [Solirubrobacteraceae bacterium]|nr:G1 family glutamic endopeptidase [Solirubrobacteraceae bacterium]
MLALAVVAVAAAAVAGASSAFGNALRNQASPNWSGWFVLSPPHSQRLAKHFTTVTGSWIQPSATCQSHHASFAAFWVGLGGYYGPPRSNALEQVGSEADCSSSGRLFYYAWYEFVPALPATIHAVKIRPGDSLSATVHASSDHVTVTFTDNTTGKSFRHTITMRHPVPDTSAAEWIAEAPSILDSAGHLTPLLLTNFGQIGFTAASATSIGYGGRHTGAIDDPLWNYGEIVLSSNGHLRYSPTEKSYALPSLLNIDGTSFNVRYGPIGPTGPTGPTTGIGPTGPTGATA